MTLPVPNLTSPLVDKLGKLIPPWNSWFQQFSQKAPAIVTVAASPFTANTNGTVIFTGGAPVITLTRGTVSIVLTGQRIVPISISDTITWAGATTVQFLGA